MGSAKLLSAAQEEGGWVEILAGLYARAFLAGIIVAILCPTIGIFSLRRQSMMGDMFHTCLSRGSFRFITGIYPLAAALTLSLAAAAAVEVLRRNYRIFSDLAIAIHISAGTSLAVILISLSRAYNADLFSYLFGSVIAISRRDLYLISAVGLLIIVIISLLRKELFILPLMRTVPGRQAFALMWSIQFLWPLPDDYDGYAGCRYTFSFFHDPVPVAAAYSGRSFAPQSTGPILSL